MRYHRPGPPVALIGGRPARSPPREPMDLSVREVAKLLNVSEETVYRWVHSGSLKSHRVDDQYRFNRVEIQEWAAQHNHRVSPELLAPGGTSGLPSLHAAISRGGVFHG